jgi:hypothetical protein
MPKEGSEHCPENANARKGVEVKSREEIRVGNDLARDELPPERRLQHLPCTGGHWRRVDGVERLFEKELGQTKGVTVD